MLARDYMFSVLQVAHLELNRIHVTQHTLDCLRGCSRLQHLHLNQCRVSAGRLPALPKLTALVVNVPW